MVFTIAEALMASAFYLLNVVDFIYFINIYKYNI